MNLTCVKCLENKSPTDFYKSKRRLSGYDCYCKKCRSHITGHYFKSSYWAKKKYSLDSRWNYFNHNARRKHHETLLTKEQFNELIQLPCAYCGGVVISTGSGLDRKDSAKGYVLDNVVPCCTDCNTMKLEKTPNEFITKITLLYNHLVVARLK